jgi:hypothetical protein
MCMVSQKKNEIEYQLFNVIASGVTTVPKIRVDPVQQNMVLIKFTVYYRMHL